MEDEAERLGVIFCRPVMLLDPRVEAAEALRIEHLVTVLDQAVRRADDLEQELGDRYAAHPFHWVVSRVPGIGTVLGAYLLAEVGGIHRMG
ncbi:hypothetical protein [Streptomyces sp. NPDC018045]|uniref:hypothetical protein n=1 Tax=Streptomyces sp. NPDC018045 TaxID=3365037 RepID=UPI0037971140